MLRVNIKMRIVVCLLLLFASDFIFAGNSRPCENFRDTYGPGSYGPYDYTNPVHFRDKLPVVENGHFNSNVENLIKGLSSADLMFDIDYTLRAFPNHHRALYSMSRFMLKNKSYSSPRIFSPECYFQRAQVFSPDDGVVYMLNGIYLHRKEKYKEALSKYELALTYLPDSSEIKYNIGLLYYDMEDFTRAKEFAKKAYSQGFPLDGLKRKLIKNGSW